MTAHLLEHTELEIDCAPCRLLDIDPQKGSIPAMEYSRRITIADVVIDEKSALKLVAICLDHRAARRENHWEHRLECEIAYYDGSEVRFDEPPKDLSVYFDKPVRALGLTMRSKLKSGARFISFALNHGDSTYTTTVIRITGEEEDWVNSTYAQLSDWLRHVPPQFTWIRRKSFWILQALAPPFGYIIVTKWFWLMKAADAASTSSKSTSSSWTPGLIALSIATIWMAGMVPASILLDRLKSLWPSVELNLGPRHLLSHLSKRKKTEVIATLIVVPILGGFVYDISKWLFGL